MYDVRMLHIYTIIKSCIKKFIFLLTAEETENESGTGHELICENTNKINLCCWNEWIVMLVWCN